MLDTLIASNEVNRSKKDGIHHLLGRKQWSNGEGDGIIDDNQEMIDGASLTG